MFKFLIDECLTPDLALAGRARGHDGFHVNWLQFNGYRDQSLSAFAVAEDAVLVTNNGADFRPIYRALDLHPGLVVILPSVGYDEQMALYAQILDMIEVERDLINKLVEIDVNGVIAISNFPPFRDNL